MQSKVSALLSFVIIGFVLSSCGANRKLQEVTFENEANIEKISECEKELEILKNRLIIKEEQVEELKEEKSQKTEQNRVMTVLSQEAFENIRKTIKQLDEKNKYIQKLKETQFVTDSINLALAINIKSALEEGLDDEDVDVEINKTAVFINLSDKMLFKSGSHELSAEANKVLEKVALIIKSREGLEVMVEGYTDNWAISNDCIEDNWDLSVKRATTVVRVLQTKFKVDPNRLIAAGRGQYNALADNSTAAGRATNRRTRIIILPKLNEFYDILNPDTELKLD